MTPVNGYCVKCKKTVPIVDPVKKQTKNGRSMMQGTCGTCVTKVNVFVKA